MVSSLFFFLSAHKFKILSFFVDIDECMNADRGGCIQNCVNLQGSYECSCQQGYNIASDGFNCDGKRLII